MSHRANSLFFHNWKFLFLSIYIVSVSNSIWKHLEQDVENVSLSRPPSVLYLKIVEDAREMVLFFPWWEIKFWNFYYEYILVI